MGNWGYKLYQDDVALDVKDEFIELLKKGMDCLAATKKILEENIDVLNDEDDAPIFWFALADVQWKYGILLDVVKEKALFYIEDGGNLAKWQEEEPKQAKKRAEVLESLRQTLLSPQPPVKKIHIPKQYRCEWKIGDTYAYPLTSEYAKEHGLSGEYFIFHKVGETTCYPNHIIPVVWVKITQNGHLPQTIAEFNALKYVQIAAKDLFSIKGDSAQPDEFGYYPIYRLALLNTSKRMIPKSLLFLGNFENVIPPTNECFPKYDNNFSIYRWDIFEEIVIKLYIVHTLKQGPLYSKKI